MTNSWKIVMSSLAMSVALAVGGAAYAEPPLVAIRPEVTVPVVPHVAGVQIVPRSTEVPIVPNLAPPVRFRHELRCRAGEIRFRDGRCHSRALARYRFPAQRPLRPIGYPRRARALYGWR